MNKEERRALKQQLAEEKERMYNADPEVKHWIKTKRTIFWALAVYWIVHALLSIIALQQIGAGFRLATDVLRPLFQLFWIYVFISPNGTWRVNVVFYFWALSNLALNFNNYMSNLQGYFQEAVAQIPVLGVVFFMEVLVPFLFLGIACYLTIPKSHRELSDRVQNMQRELLESFKKMSEK